MDESARDGAAVRFPPPLVYLLALIAGVLLHALLPLRFELASGVRIVLAAVAALLGLAFIAGAIGLFKRTGQDPKPWKATPEIISTGVYGFTRNPMYVGMASLQLAIGVGLANGWLVALVPLVLVIIYWTAIRHEEAYLERKFGAAYTEYKRSVRRWM